MRGLARFVEAEVELGDEREVIGRLACEAAGTGVAVAGVNVAADEDAVERADREDRGEGVDELAGAAEARGLEEARAEGAPEIVEVAAEYDRGSMVEAAEGIAREEALEL